MVASLRGWPVLVVLAVAVVAGGVAMTTGAAASDAGDEGEQPLLEAEASTVSGDRIVVDFVVHRPIDSAVIAFQDDSPLLDFVSMGVQTGTDGDASIDVDWNPDAGPFTVLHIDTGPGDSTAPDAPLVFREYAVVETGTATISFVEEETTIVGQSGDPLDGSLVGLEVTADSTAVTVRPEPTPTPIGPPDDDLDQGAGASFELRGLDVPATVDPGESVTVGYTVTNVGDATETAFAELRVGDRSIDVTPVELAAGATHTVTVEVSADELQPGTHEVVVDVVDDVRSADVIARGSEDDLDGGAGGSDEGGDERLPGFGVVIAMGVTVLTVAFAGHCRR